MHTQPKRVFLCGIAQESNAFNPIPSSLNFFGKSKATLSGYPQIKGALPYLQEQGVEVISGLHMSAASGAPAEDGVVSYFLESVLSDLRQAGPLDGVLMAMHGATMSETSFDVCGDLIEAVRREVGEELPIAVSFDLHANITEKVAKNADYICGYHEYPHIDMPETGLRAAKLLVEHMNGNKARCARVAIPMIAPAHGYTTKTGGLKKLTDLGRKLVEEGKILDFSIFQVQPWLDTPEMASTVIVVAKDETTAKETALNLAKENFALRQELLGSPLMTVEEVIEKALENKSGKPVVLVDSADSRGAGANSDSAAVIEALLPYSDRLTCALSVLDKPAVEKAFALGAGIRADFTLGATLAPKLSRPVTLKNALIRSLHTGEFTLHGPISKGAISHIGRTAVLQVGKLLIQVSTNAHSAGDLNYYHSFGIDPHFCDLVSVKACTSFRAGYESVAAEICNTATPGAAGTVLEELPYENRPTPMFPFEEITETDITAPVCHR